MSVMKTFYSGKAVDLLISNKPVLIKSVAKPPSFNHKNHINQELNSSYLQNTTRYRAVSPNISKFPLDVMTKSFELRSVSNQSRLLENDLKQNSKVNYNVSKETADHRFQLLQNDSNRRVEKQLAGSFSLNQNCTFKPAINTNTDTLLQNSNYTSSTLHLRNARPEVTIYKEQAKNLLDSQILREKKILSTPQGGQAEYFDSLSKSRVRFMQNFRKSQAEVLQKQENDDVLELQSGPKINQSSRGMTFMEGDVVARQYNMMEIAKSKKAKIKRDVMTKRNRENTFNPKINKYQLEQDDQYEEAFERMYVEAKAQNEVRLKFQKEMKGDTLADTIEIERSGSKPLINNKSQEIAAKQMLSSNVFDRVSCPKYNKNEALVKQLLHETDPQIQKAFGIEEKQQKKYQIVKEEQYGEFMNRLYDKGRDHIEIREQLYDVGETTACLLANSIHTTISSQKLAVAKKRKFLCKLFDYLVELSGFEPEEMKQITFQDVEVGIQFIESMLTSENVYSSLFKFMIDQGRNKLTKLDFVAKFEQILIQQQVWYTEFGFKK